MSARVWRLLVVVLLAHPIRCAAGEAAAAIPIQSADGNFQQALKSYLRDDYPESLRLLRQCLDLDPAHPKAVQLLPLVLKRQDESLRLQGATADSVLAEEHFRAGLGLYIVGNLGAATEELKKTLALAPAHENAKVLLAKIAAQTKPKGPEPPPPLLPPEKASQRISLNFKDAAITDILTTLSSLYQLNIIASSDVGGTITTNFVDVSLEEALKTILDLGGYAARTEGSVLRVYKVDESAVTSKTFRLRHASLTTDQVDAIKDALSSDGKLFYDSKTHTVMVTETAKNLKTLEELMGRLDTQRKQVLIEARVLDVNLNDARNLGVDWTHSLSLTATSTTRPITFPWVPGTSPAIEQFFPRIAPASVGTDFLSGNRGELPLTSASNFTLGRLTGPNLAVVLNALETKTDTAILSNPSILAMDEEEAKIVIGTNYPIPTFERNETTGTFEVTGYTERQIGVVLTVTPQVFDENRITVTLHPEVSAVTGTLSGAIPYPIISTREATTKVSLKDRETVVLGGMISERDVEVLKKLPLISNAPFFGTLFKNRNKTKERTDLMVFVTVTIAPS